MDTRTALRGRFAWSRDPVHDFRWGVEAAPTNGASSSGLARIAPSASHAQDLERAEARIGRRDAAGVDDGRSGDRASLPRSSTEGSPRGRAGRHRLPRRHDAGRRSHRHAPADRDDPAAHSRAARGRDDAALSAVGDGQPRALDFRAPPGGAGHQGRRQDAAVAARSGGCTPSASSCPRVRKRST